MTDANFSDNQDRFELHENGHVAYARDRRSGDVFAIPYVEAAVELRGTGAAGRLMTQVALRAREQGFKIDPLCPYAVAWYRRHPEFADTLAE